MPKAQIKSTQCIYCTTNSNATIVISKNAQILVKQMYFCLYVQICMLIAIKASKKNLGKYNEDALKNQSELESVQKDKLLTYESVQIVIACTYFVRTKDGKRMYGNYSYWHNLHVYIHTLQVKVIEITAKNFNHGKSKLPRCLQVLQIRQHPKTCIKLGRIIAIVSVYACILKHTDKRILIYSHRQPTYSIRIKVSKMLATKFNYRAGQNISTPLVTGSYRLNPCNVKVCIIPSSCIQKQVHTCLIEFTPIYYIHKGSMTYRKVDNFQ
eukprot:TRINITY_DN2203_c0_g1_i3.p2 TRINITY_DN2203_c0_g1~~TRINITY_DN2203_c0_g1_i3.p2  ORF type:complete len:268 (-),score=-17.21 TRINITY_DN2203_c0_g1_i3:785-1588(-)